MASQERTAEALQRHLSVSEVAERLGVTEQTVKAHYIKRLGLPAVRLGSQTLRVPVDALEAWLEARMVAAVVDQAPALSDDQRATIEGALKSGGGAA